LERKDLLERLISADDRRSVTVRLTERGAANYALVRREWAAAVCKAAAKGARNLDAVLGVLGEIEAGLIEMRPRQPGRNMDHAEE
jgi:DNA-binding MarR family transcriptional regulator